MQAAGVGPEDIDLACAARLGTVPHDGEDICGKASPLREDGTRALGEIEPVIGDFDRGDDIKLRHVGTDGAPKGSETVVNGVKTGKQTQPGHELKAHKRSDTQPTRLYHQATPELSLPEPHVETTALDPDEIWFEQLWPAGMTKTSAPVLCLMSLRFSMATVRRTSASA
mgnify:CR=1 FL=1